MSNPTESSALLLAYKPSAVLLVTQTIYTSSADACTNIRSADDMGPKCDQQC